MLVPEITLSNFPFFNYFYDGFIILLYIIFIYIVILFISEGSNIITKHINTWIKSPVIIIIIHLFIICFLYYFVRLFIPFITVDISIVIIIIGPMLGILSNYFKPFTVLCKKILDGKKSIKEIF